MIASSGAFNQHVVNKDFDILSNLVFALEVDEQLVGGPHIL